MLNKGFGDVGDPKVASTGTTGSQFLEQYKTAQALAQLAAQRSQTGPPNTTPSSWDTSGTSLVQYGETTFQKCYFPQITTCVVLLNAHNTDVSFYSVRIIVSLSIFQI